MEQCAPMERVSACHLEVRLEVGHVLSELVCGTAFIGNDLLEVGEAVDELCDLLLCAGVLSLRLHRNPLVLSTSAVYTLNLMTGLEPHLLSFFRALVKDPFALASRLLMTIRHPLLERADFALKMRDMLASSHEMLLKLRRAFLL